MRRFFVKENQIKQNKFVIEDFVTIKHIRNVLRLQVNDQIELFTGKGIIYSGRINKLQKNFLSGNIENIIEEKESRPYLILAQALPRAGKLDDIVQMNTEAGVREFRLFESEFSVLKINNFKASKIDRLERVIQQAARQSERAIIPQVSMPQTFTDILKIKADFKFLLHSRAVKDSININEAKKNIKKDSKILIIIGPEGGFSPAEIKLALEDQIQIMYLNLPIMRTQTAGLVVCSYFLL